MPAHVYHHYVPRFYLNRWTVNNQITRFQWINNQFECRLIGIKRTAGMNHLYALKHYPQDPQLLERDFMGPLIDGPAAEVCQHLCQSSAPLTGNQRASWTRFLMSLRIRGPEVIDRLRTEAEEELRQNLMASPEEYNKLRSPEDPVNLYDYLEKLRPGFVADFGIRMLPDLLNDGPIFKKIYEMYWWTHSFDGASVNLLTSDSPLIISTGINNGNCVIALPLSPSLCFFATHNLKTASRVASRPASRLARALNLETVKQARQFVYSNNQLQKKFIEKHLKKVE